MIAHVVLFRPKADLPAPDAEALVGALETALRGIPQVQRAQVGTRVLIGRGYEQMMRADFPYAVILEFADVTALREYLEHPAHQELGARVFGAAEEALVYDFEMESGAAGLAALVAR